MSKIYVFGNSHVCVFSQITPSMEVGARHISLNGHFITRILGGTIAYNFYEHHYPKLLKFLESEKEFDKSKDYVLLVVGEVDCRLHLVEQINKQGQRLRKDIIGECVNRFFRCHLDLKKRGYQVIGWGNHPAAVEPHQYTLGSYPERLFIARFFEKCIRQRCLENEIIFKTIFNLVLMSNETPNKDLYIDYCHLNPLGVSEIIDREFKDLIDI